MYDNRDQARNAAPIKVRCTEWERDLSALAAALAGQQLATYVYQNHMAQVFEFLHKHARDPQVRELLARCPNPELVRAIDAPRQAACA